MGCGASKDPGPGAPVANVRPSCSPRTSNSDAPAAAAVAQPTVAAPAKGKAGTGASAATPAVPAGATTAPARTYNPKSAQSSNTLSPSTTLKPSQRAVSMAWLESFAASLPSASISSRQVARRVVAPATRQARPGSGGSGAAAPGQGDGYGSYAELLLARGGDSAAAVSMGRPYHYVVHASSRPFDGTVTMLRKHFAAEAQHAQHEGRPAEADGDIFLWLDVFAVDQRGGAGGVGAESRRISRDSGSGGAAVGGDVEAVSEADLAILREAMAEAESVLFVLDDDAAALRRLGCLYELWLAAAAARPLRVLTYDQDFEALRYAIADLDVAAVASSDTASSDARGAAGASLLDEMLAGSRGDGVDAVSRALRDALVASILAEARQDQQRPESGPLAAAAAAATSGGAADADGARWSAAAIFRLDRAARMLEALGRLAEAEVLFRRVLTATEAALGTEHPDTLTSVANLASLLHDHGRLAEAEPLLRRVLSATERALGVTHHETAASLEALAMLLEQQGRLPEAEAAFRRALTAYEAALGPDSRDTLAAANNLAHVLRLQGGPAALAQAEALYRRALAGYEAVLGADHPDALAGLNNLAIVLKDAGRLEEAEALYRQALQGCEASLGPDHPHTLSAVNNLAAALQARGELASAEALFRRALSGREAALGADHPDTLGSVNNLAVLLQAHGQFAEAEPLFRRALSGWETKLGPEHADTLTAAFNLGVVLEALGQPAEALELYRREAAGRTRRGEATRATQRQVHIDVLAEQMLAQAAVGAGDSRGDGDGGSGGGAVGVVCG